MKMPKPKKSLSTMISKLSFQKLAIISCLIALAIAAYGAYVYINVRLSATGSPADYTLDSISKQQEKLIQSTLKKYPTAVYATVFKYELQKNALKVVYSTFADETKLIPSSTNSIIPLFIEEGGVDKDHNSIMINLVRAGFACGTTKDSEIIPDQKIVFSCRTAVPPSYGAGRGYIVFNFSAEIKGYELEALRFDLLNLANLLAVTAP